VTHSQAAAVAARLDIAPAASPHRMVTLLLDGAIGRLGRAADEQPLAGSESLAAAVAIIEALQGSLDMARGGLLAANLNDLYDYMLRRLGHAASAGDAGPLAEVAGLLDTIREGWAAIAPEVEASTA
jgi:flagellar protein FliS